MHCALIAACMPCNCNVLNNSATRGCFYCCCNISLTNSFSFASLLRKKDSSKLLCLHIYFLQAACNTYSCVICFDRKEVWLMKLGSCGSCVCLSEIRRPCNFVRIIWVGQLSRLIQIVLWLPWKVVNCLDTFLHANSCSAHPWHG